MTGPPTRNAHASGGSTIAGPAPANLTAPPAGILVEAEEFDDYGGWVMDSQFDIQMGSPYLLAHGLGRPVADASTIVRVDQPGRYNIWVRAKDWVPAHHPGRFTLSVNNTVLPVEFGANAQDWSWQPAGALAIPAGNTRLTLHDLTGFDARCDAIFLSRNTIAPPDGADAAARTWRRRMRGLSETPTWGGDFDVIVVGGGVTGSAAALTAARLGSRVALIHNRPVLGGNASVEIGLTPRGEAGPLVDELSARTSGGDLHALELLRAQANASVFLDHTVFDAVVRNSTIVSIDARHARSGRETRFSAPIFIDCSGTAALALLAGVPTMFGHEARSEFGESLAPEHRLDEHHGNTVFFRTRMGDEPAYFPDVPWAVEVSKDYANLGGQLVRPGNDNGPGPIAGPAKTPDPNVQRRMLLPLTHFWEYGQHLDPYTEAEHIRDHLLRALYGTFANVKQLEPDTYANLELEWVGFVPGQGEFRRYRGEYILTETDIGSHRHFPDTVVHNSGPFCLHYPGDERHDFRLKDWRWIPRDEEPFEIPFRCLYAADLDNVMMAGKHISVTHIAGSTTKFMGNGAQHAIATAAAALLCAKYGVTPKQVHRRHLPELKALTASIAVGDLPSG